MAIDVLKDELIGMDAVAALLPQKPHVATVYRWATRGLNGVVLETVFTRPRFTTVEAVQRFARESAAAGVGRVRVGKVAPVRVARGRSDVQRARDLAEAEAELERAGCW